MFVAGLSGETPGNKGDARAQTSAAVAKLQSAMQQSGFSLSDAVEGVEYVPDAGKLPDVDSVYRAGFSGQPPALTRVGAGLVVPDAEGEFSPIAHKH